MYVKKTLSIDDFPQIDTGKNPTAIMYIFPGIRRLVINVSSISKVHLSFRHKKNGADVNM